MSGAKNGSQARDFLLVATKYIGLTLPFDIQIQFVYIYAAKRCTSNFAKKITARRMRKMKKQLV